MTSPALSFTSMEKFFNFPQIDLMLYDIRFGRLSACIHLFSRRKTFLKAGLDCTPVHLAGRKPIITGITVTGLGHVMLQSDVWLNQDFSIDTDLTELLLDIVVLVVEIEQFPSNWGIILVIGWGAGGGGKSTPLTSLKFQTCLKLEHCISDHTCSHVGGSSWTSF